MFLEEEGVFVVEIGKEGVELVRVGGGGHIWSWDCG